ncbi:hypothetical protein KFK09_020523 [Dendrobium nobile]|uniref:Uncharacterized protein n=1 Tax=Dendrobium nobile TaxID=94219 RepID=A0A8T3AMG4_DENNO|nr:hypothetical protein KFK09_020523 [Dendrobium nobile]
MFSSGAAGDDAPPEIINDEKFFSRLLSKEISASANPSFRVYYGVASGTVPFLWESQPGTPKHTMPTTILPPLTPPPSFYFNPSKNSNNKPFPKPPKRKLIHAILPRPALRKLRGVQNSPSVSSSSGRSSDEEENDEARISPTSTMCFGERLALKKALLYIVGHGSGHGGSA